MYFVVLGLLLIVCNLAGIGPMGQWQWDEFGDLVKMLWPFGLAVIWWVWADQTGYNKRREIEKLENKRLARREANLEALGMDKRGRKKKRRALP
jgi:small Trp-rich protein